MNASSLVIGESAQALLSEPLEAQLSRLREVVLTEATRRDSYHHGERHWRAVAWAGLQLSRDLNGCRPLVVLLFALFHDALRKNEYSDPEHGLRGANLSRRIAQEGLLPLDDADAETLFIACRDHTAVDRSDDPTIGACWDSDRLNLWRVGTEPNPRFLSTLPAREPELIRAAATFHDRDHDWHDMTRGYLALQTTA